MLLVCLPGGGELLKDWFYLMCPENGEAGIKALPKRAVGASVDEDEAAVCCVLALALVLVCCCCCSCCCHKKIRRQQDMALFLMLIIVANFFLSRFEVCNVTHSPSLLCCCVSFAALTVVAHVATRPGGPHGHVDCAPRAGICWGEANRSCRHGAAFVQGQVVFVSAIPSHPCCLLVLGLRLLRWCYLFLTCGLHLSCACLLSLMPS